MPALYSHVTRSTGTVLTAAIYNDDHNNHITNGTPQQHDDYSTSQVQMQSAVDPGEVGSESFATSLAGELERLRFALNEIKTYLGLTSAQWYVTPTGVVAAAKGGTGLTSLGAGIATFLGTPSSANLAAAVSDETGSGALVFATSPTLGEATLSGATYTWSGNPTHSGNHTFSGHLSASITQNSQSAAYTTVLADANKHILHPTADNNARTFTIDSNVNVAYPIGTAITFVNQINVVTIAITADTLTLAGSGLTGSRTLAANGIATALKVSTTGWVISGTGLS